MNNGKLWLVEVGFHLHDKEGSHRAVYASLDVGEACMCTVRYRWLASSPGHSQLFNVAHSV